MADGLARSGFDKDLAFGEAKETAFVACLRDCQVECKADQKMRSTGNIAIEIRQGHSDPGQGKLSGLSVTTAAWWAIEYADDCWLVIRTSLLKAVVRSTIQERRDGGARPTVMGGDHNRYELVLVPVFNLLMPVKLTP